MVTAVTTSVRLLVKSLHYGLSQPEYGQAWLSPQAAVSKVYVLVGASEGKVEVGKEHLVPVVKVDVHSAEARCIYDKLKLQKCKIVV